VETQRVGVCSIRAGGPNAWAGNSNKLVLLLGETSRSPGSMASRFISIARAPARSMYSWKPQWPTNHTAARSP
jgi:hypothetical protein